MGTGGGDQVDDVAPDRVGHVHLADGLYELDDMLELLQGVGFEPQAEQWELANLPPGDEYALITAVKRPAEKDGA